MTKMVNRVFTKWLDIKNSSETLGNKPLNMWFVYNLRTTFRLNAIDDPNVSILL